MRERLLARSFLAPARPSPLQVRRSCNGGDGCRCMQCRNDAGASAPPSVSRAIRSTGAPLEPAVRAALAPRLGTAGAELGGVRVHTDDLAAASASEIGARAYTVGRDVVFGRGEYAPGSSEGQKLLAHELAHVAQQRLALANAPAGPLTLGAADDAHEREADHFAAANDHAPLASAAPVGVVQRATKWAAFGGFDVAMKPFTTGASGTITFKPDATACPACTNLRLVQVVRVFEKPGQDYLWPGAEAPRENVKTAEDKKKGVKPNFLVDHSAANCTAATGCSMYYRDHWSNSSVSQDGSCDGKTATSASLWDSPTGDADDLFQFETCAHCADPASKRWLNCVTWGFTADHAGAVTMSPEAAHYGPSATFKAAIATFNTYYKNP